ncbi:MAG: SDR family oxidoreductase [Chloroflexi bacterium]|nr:SDR family oxidoreductase [Chloroflexota bacterium]MCI0885696.1 SDR family oxidoreductase [Chloroflexota bacterium]
MKDKTVVVTGGNNGIGLETAVGLSKLGAHVVITARNQAKGEAALADIKDRSQNGSVQLMLADFASLSSIRDFAANFKKDHDRLDVLVNNAGGVNTSRSETQDGFETTFGVNHLGYFLVTNLLLDMLKASAPARVVSVSSRAHERRKGMNFDDLNSKQSYSGMGVYGDSKLANVLFTYELARRLKGSGVTANCLHPGVVRSGFGQNNGGFISFAFKSFYTLLTPVTKSNAQGAKTSIYLASSPEVEGVTGKYFADSKETPSSPASHDEEAAKRLWEISEQMTGLAAAPA